MSRRELTRTIDLAVRAWGPRVAEAALGFEARWTRRALLFHDPKLGEQFEAQLQRFEQAMVAGTSTEIDNEGSRLCRAYALVAAALAAAKVPEDAYMIGRDIDGTTIAISATPAAGERAREIYGDHVLWFSPDEIATLASVDARAQKIAAVKAAFPGAEISSVNGD